MAGRAQTATPGPYTSVSARGAPTDGDNGVERVMEDLREGGVVRERRGWVRADTGPGAHETGLDEAAFATGCERVIAGQVSVNPRAAAQSWAV